MLDLSFSQQKLAALSSGKVIGDARIEPGDLPNPWLTGLAFWATRNTHFDAANRIHFSHHPPPMNRRVPCRRLSLAPPRHGWAAVASDAVLRSFAHDDHASPPSAQSRRIARKAYKHQKHTFNARKIRSQIRARSITLHHLPRAFPAVAIPTAGFSPPSVPGIRAELFLPRAGKSQRRSGRCRREARPSHRVSCSRQA